MHGDLTGLEEGGLIGELPRAVRRERRPGVEQQPEAHPLGRLRGGQGRAVHGLEDPAVAHPLERLGHRQHRDRGAMDAHRLGDRGDERARHERARPVVDQHGSLEMAGVHRLRVPDSSARRPSGARA